MQPLALNERHWDFANMNSPADLQAEYEADGVRLAEYDRCRGGHLLLSRDHVATRDVRLSFAVLEMQDGVGIGLYGGRGAFTNYLYAAIFRDRLEIRIPSGVPNGDMFMFEGQRNFHVLASGTLLEPLEGPFPAVFAVQGDRLTVHVRDELAAACDIRGVACLGESARVFVKAVNESGVAPRVTVKLGEVACDKLQAGHPLRGRVVDSRGQPVPQANVHLAGYGSGCWRVTDGEGRFSIERLPAGSYTVIAGGEGFAFTAQQIEHAEHAAECALHLKDEADGRFRTEYPDAGLRRSDRWSSLNGYWSFDFDPGDVGEREAWFAPGGRPLTRSIRVPFPWSSLLAFGEEELADSDALYQANPFTNYARLVGGIGWYRRTFTVPDDFDPQRGCVLHFNAVSGVSKVWFDGRLIGSILDSYNRYSFPLGNLQPGSTHTIAVKVTYPYSLTQVCSGKQGFWFTESPGIWQSVWLENRDDGYVSDIEVDYRLAFAGRVCTRAELRGQVTLDVDASAGRRIAAFRHRPLTPQTPIELDVRIPSANLYKLEIEYSAADGRVLGEVLVNGEYACDLVLDCTLDAGWSDRTGLWLPLDAGEHRLTIRQQEDPVSPGVPGGVLHAIAVCETPRLPEARVSLAAPDGAPVRLEAQPLTARQGRLCVPFRAEIASPELWDIGQPNLYRVRAEVTFHDTRSAERKIGLRRIETDRAYDGQSEIRQIYLNRKPVFIRGIMDQGYNPWGVYTYPSVDGGRGSMAYDIRTAAEYGYNLIRMHIKDNEPHWYSLCDELGMPVWDELPVNFYATADDLVWRGMYLRQLRAMMRKHRGHPSVVMFSTFNESWGIEGWHERSPWGNADAQAFIREAAREYKRLGNVLVIDNSGYAKTMETDIIDHHSYPIGYEDSRSFWEDLLAHDYPGSTFNFFHEANAELMKNSRTRELLQRNCSQDLGNQPYVGREVQAGQPVLISEFVHTDGNEKLLRMFPAVAGYTRMNLASQENEDTSYLNQLRERRDFGYVNEAMEPLPTRLINSEDAVVFDYPRLTRVAAGERVKLDVHGAIWREPAAPLRLLLTAVGIDRWGEYERRPLRERTIEVPPYRPVRLETIETGWPSRWKAAYLFAVLKENETVVAQDYVQFELERAADDPDPDVGAIGIRFGPETRVESDQFRGLELDRHRRLAWVYGTGRIEAETRVEDRQLRLLAAAGGASLVLEASSCEMIRGVKITDERKFSSDVRVFVNDLELGAVTLEDCPYDDRALFSRAAAMSGKIFRYNEHSGWGYGYRLRLPLRREHLDAIVREGLIRMTLRSAGHGVILYGNGMGRYGTDPLLRMEGPS